MKAKLLLAPPLVSVRGKKSPSLFVSGEQRRRALAESGITVVANITKDRELVAWAQDTSRALYIGRNYRGWREAGWGNPFRPQTHVPEEHDRVIGLYIRYLNDNPRLLGRLPELSGGKILLCWCHPLPCHGDVLAKCVAQYSASTAHHSCLTLLSPPLRFHMVAITRNQVPACESGGPGFSTLLHGTFDWPIQD